MMIMKITIIYHKRIEFVLYITGDGVGDAGGDGGTGSGSGSVSSTSGAGGGGGGSTTLSSSDGSKSRGSLNILAISTVPRFGGIKVKSLPSTQLYMGDDEEQKLTFVTLLMFTIYTPS